MNTITKNTETTAKGLLQYQSIIRSITHLDDTSDIDKRTLFLTVNVENVRQLEDIHKTIYMKINAFITGQARKVLPSSPALYSSDDVEGSRSNRSQLVNPISPHVHSIAVIPNNIAITDSYLVEMEEAIAQIGEIRNISPTWSVDVVLSNKAQIKDVFLDRLKHRYPQIKNISSKANSQEVTLTISKEYLKTGFELNAFMFDLKDEYSEIHGKRCPVGT